MFRKLTLSFLLTVSAFAISKTSFATIINDNGSASTYNLTSTDSLYILSGTYTGKIGSFPSGAKIFVSSSANFNPSGSPGMPNNASGTIWNYGYTTYTPAGGWTTNTGFTMNNYGTATFSAVTMNGSGQVWTNNYGGTLNFTGNVILNGTASENNSIINYETVSFGGTFLMRSGSQIINYRNMSVTSTLDVRGGTLNNQGKLDVTGKIDINNGAAIIYNYCRLIAKGGIDNSSNNFYNYNYLWAKDDLGTSTITNTGTIHNVSIFGSIPIMHARNFTQTSGLMDGSVKMYFYGTTKASGGTIGAIGVTDTIKMYDVTRTGLQIFDQPGAVINSNTIYNAWGIPDSTRAYLIGCAVETLYDAPLVINWNYFYLTVPKEFPLLNWSAYYDEGTIFQIERSYDGRNFKTIQTVPSEKNRSEYSLEDFTVDKNTLNVYYRIKAVEPSGNEKYSQTRTVRFDSKPGKMKIAPNPFTTNFIIDYNAPVKENIIVRIFNTNGQQKLEKSISINAGYNRIDINEAANFATGVYIVQVSNGSSIISSGKIIKQ